MRVTDSMRYGAITRSLASIASQQAEAARRASTGKRVGAPSSDPTAAADLVRTRASRERAAAHRDTIATVRGDAALAEGMLDEATTLFARAHEIAMQGANGSLSANERASLATEVRGLFEELVSIANTKGARGAIFAGTATGAPPFDPTGTFVGNGLDRVAELGPGLVARVNVSGERTFTAAGGRDVFADLAALETALLANDAAATAATLDGLGQSRAQIVTARADAGLLLQRLDTSDIAIERASHALSIHESAVGDADAAETLSSLTLLGQALERAVAVARTTLDSSLIRF